MLEKRVKWGTIALGDEQRDLEKSAGFAEPHIFKRIGRFLRARIGKELVDEFPQENVKSVCVDDF